MRVSVLLLVSLLAFRAQDEGAAARALAFLWRTANGPPPQRPAVLAILPDTASGSSASPEWAQIAARLTRAGVSLVARSARPHADTLLLRVTVPGFDTVTGHWYIGFWALACRQGRLQGYRSVATIDCGPVNCRYAPYVGTSIRDPLDEGPCPSD